MRERFSIFAFAIIRIYKYIKALESELAARIGVKGVHVFWIYTLFCEPDGLTASEIAQKNHVNRSLVSREIVRLEKEEIIAYRDEQDCHNKYNAKIVLTDKGKEVARSIFKAGLETQQAVGRDIADGELKTFYSVLGRLADNLSHISLK